MELENLKRLREGNKDNSMNINIDEQHRKESLRNEARRLMNEALKGGESVMIKSSIDSFQNEQSL